MSLNPFDEGFDAGKTLSAPVESFLSALPSSRDRAIADRTTPLNNIAACASVEHAPFRILKSSRVRDETRERGVKRTRETRVDVLGGLHEHAGKGPLLVLKKAVEKRFRVRVVLRERHDLAGFVDGFVVAFDKHFNLVIRHAWVVKEGRRRIGQLFVRGENVVLVRVL